MLGCATIRIGSGHFDRVLVDVIPMRMMQMPIMQIVDMFAMPDGRVPASGSMLMRMIGVVRLITRAHCASS